MKKRLRALTSSTANSYLVKELRIEDLVHFVPKAIARDGFAKRDSPIIVMQPTACPPFLTEGLGAVGIEATAFATPFIGTNVRGIP